MEIDLITQLYYQDRTEFKRPVWSFKWNVLVLVESGSYQLKLENRQKPLILKENDIIFIPPDLQVERTVLAPLSFYHFSFRAQADHPFYRSATVGKLSLSEQYTKPILQSVKQAMILPDNRELITHIIEHIFAENYLFGRSKKTKLVPISEEVTSTVSYINKHLGEELDIDELAARVYLSHSGLIWKFKKELGTTPSRYVSLQRLLYAKQLLLNHPDYTVTQIADLLGYDSIHYFSRFFKKMSGQTPSEFRREHRTGNDYEKR